MSSAAWRTLNQRSHYREDGGRLQPGEPSDEAVRMAHRAERELATRGRPRGRAGISDGPESQAGISAPPMRGKLGRAGFSDPRPVTGRASHPVPIPEANPIQRARLAKRDEATRRARMLELSGDDLERQAAARLITDLQAGMVPIPPSSHAGTYPEAVAWARKRAALWWPIEAVLAEYLTLLRYSYSPEAFSPKQQEARAVAALVAADAEYRAAQAAAVGKIAGLHGLAGYIQEFPVFTTPLAPMPARSKQGKRSGVVR